MMSNHRALAPIAALALLSGCGSGGNEEASSANDASAQDAAPTQMAEAIPAHSPALAGPPGDPVAGKKSFGQCQACHTVEKGGAEAAGPNLAGVFGSKAASRRPDFPYSPALKASGLTWDAATLDRWIEDPLKTVPGTSMHFIGVPRKPTRANIIAYLETVKE
jgi:cytochrome c